MNDRVPGENVLQQKEKVLRNKYGIAAIASKRMFEVRNQGTMLSDQVIAGILEEAIDDAERHQEVPKPVQHKALRPMKQRTRNRTREELEMAKENERKIREKLGQLPKQTTIEEAKPKWVNIAEDKKNTATLIRNDTVPFVVEKPRPAQIPPLRLKRDSYEEENNNLKLELQTYKRTVKDHESCLAKEQQVARVLFDTQTAYAKASNQLYMLAIANGVILVTIFIQVILRYAL